MTRRELFQVMRSANKATIDEQITFLINHVQEIIHTEGEGQNDVDRKIAVFKNQFKTKWSQVGRSTTRFLNTYSSWLDMPISFTIFEQPTSFKRGRPEIEFEDCAERTKRKKSEDLRKSKSIAELSFATQMSFRSSGNPDAAKILKEITSSSPTTSSKFLKAYQSSNNGKSEKMTGEDALALFIDARFSRHQYNLVRMSSPDRYPSYKVLQLEKKKCYPNKCDVKLSDTSVEVKTQAILDLTVERLFKVLNNVVEPLGHENLKNMCLISKWGFDGSSGHSAYKQAFHGPEASDSAVFITSFVPIRLLCDEKIIWQNPRPSSTRYCRPLKISFLKESIEVSLAEKLRVDKEIKQLTSSEFMFNNQKIGVSHSLIFCMVDGKICNSLTGTTSTQRCYICNATSKDFNSIDKMISMKINTENLKFGISVLHGWIRFFESLLHLAYKLPIKKWQARGEDKLIVETNKKRIQQLFREKTGLIVDVPKPGFGNSNDGNTARRFFSNPELSAEITGIDVELIKKMHIILIAVSSGYEINIDRFRAFSHDTAKHFVKYYHWYCMPPTLHKFFIHGADIISSALLPIGQLTEEAQEARNKDFKKYREHYSRKCSREKSNEDVFNQFLLSSDPLLTSKRQLPKKKLQCLPEQALELLVLPIVNDNSSLNSNVDSTLDSDSDTSSDTDIDSS